MKLCLPFNLEQTLEKAKKAVHLSKPAEMPVKRWRNHARSGCCIQIFQQQIIGEQLHPIQRGHVARQQTCTANT